MEVHSISDEILYDEFENLTLGQAFQPVGSDSVFMKTKDFHLTRIVHFNAVNLSDGDLSTFEDNEKVRVVKAVVKFSYVPKGGEVDGTN